MKAHGGLITMADLAAYKAVERAPLTAATATSPSSPRHRPAPAASACSRCSACSRAAATRKPGPARRQQSTTWPRSMRRFYADRNAYLGDPDFVKNPVASLLDPAYLAKRRSSIDPMKATPSAHPRRRAGRRAAESAETTHFNVVDAEGNAVAVTYTLNGGFGNGITVPGLGFLLNNEMDDFTTKPGAPNLFGLVQGEANTIAPGKRPLSSMTPTIVAQGRSAPHAARRTRRNRASPPRCCRSFSTSSTSAMNPQEAVDAPRFHHQWLPDAIGVERGFSPDTLGAASRARTRGEAGYRPGLRRRRGDREGRRVARGRSRRTAVRPRVGLLKHRRHVGQLSLGRHPLRRDLPRSGRHQWRRRHKKRCSTALVV